MIRPLLAMAGVAKRLNEQQFARFAAHAMHSPASDLSERYETMFAGVKCLPPATAMTVGQGGLFSRRTWWRPDPSREVPRSSDQEYYEGVRDLTIRAVHDRMRSHRPVVCYLSGGLDSSSITCIAARKLREQGQGLTAISSVLPPDHPGPEQDERQFIDIVKRAEDLQVHYVHPRQSMVDDAAVYLDWFESPVANPKGYVHRAFHEAAEACGAGVILDGCGGEIGPTNHAHGLFAYLARRGRWRLLGRELRAMSRLTGDSTFRLLLRHVIAPHFLTLQSLYHRIRHPADHVGAMTLPLNEHFVQRHRLDSRMVPNNPKIGPRSDPKKRLAFAIERMQGGLVNQTSLAHGIRTWFPFFDRRIVDYCLAVPAQLYHVDGWKRNLIRQAMDGILPPEIQWRKCKAPFSPDFYRRFQNERQALRDQFTAIGPNDMARDYYDIDAIIRRIDDLADRPGHETSPEGFQVKLCIQSSLAGIRFLQWFQGVNVDVASTRKAA